MVTQKQESEIRRINESIETVVGQFAHKVLQSVDTIGNSPNEFEEAMRGNDNYRNHFQFLSFVSGVPNIIGSEIVLNYDEFVNQLSVIYSDAREKQPDTTSEVIQRKTYDLDFNSIISRD